MADYDHCEVHGLAHPCEACSVELGVRDQLAMSAMQGMLAAKRDEPMRGYAGWREEFCAEAYRWADAMLAVRSNPGVTRPNHQTKCSMEVDRHEDDTDCWW